MLVGDDVNTEQMLSLGESLAKHPRWAPFCEGLKGQDRAICAIMLENQRRHYRARGITETTKTLQIGNWDKIGFPIIRAVYPNLIANDLVSVQPMNGPVGLVFYLDYLYANAKGAIASGTAAFDSRTGPTGNETFSSDVVTGEAATVAAGDIDHTTAFKPIRPGTITLSYVCTTDGAVTVTDDGNGAFNAVPGTETQNAINYSTGKIDLDPANSDITGTPTISYRYDNEAQDNVSQIDIQLSQAPVHAITRKLKGRWSLEAAQNLQALQGLDAEAEIVGILAEVIKQEQDREIINNLRDFAGSGTVTWDKNVPAGVSWTDHKLSLRDAFISANNLVFGATKRIQTNWAVCGLGVCDVIESLPDFVPEAGAKMSQANAGVLRIGTLKGQWTIYKDPFYTSNQWLQGAKGTSFTDAGYVWAPYVPLYGTPTVILDDFIGRKGIGTSYGQKPINNRMFVKGQIV